MSSLPSDADQTSVSRNRLILIVYTAAIFTSALLLKCTAGRPFTATADHVGREFVPHRVKSLGAPFFVDHVPTVAPSVIAPPPVSRRVDGSDASSQKMTSASVAGL